MRSLMKVLLYANHYVCISIISLHNPLKKVTSKVTQLIYAGRVSGKSKSSGLKLVSKVSIHSNDIVILNSYSSERWKEFLMICLTLSVLVRKRRRL